MPAMLDTATYCAILGVSPGATLQELRSAFKRCALATHPDKEGGSKEAFQRALLAFETLVASGAFQHSASAAQSCGATAAANKHPVPARPGTARPCPEPFEVGGPGKRRRCYVEPAGPGSKTWPPTSKAEPPHSMRWQQLAAAAAEKERQLMGKVFHLLQQLSPPRRLRALRERLNQAQRLALEAWATENRSTAAPQRCGSTPALRDESDSSSEDFSPEPERLPEPAPDLAEVAPAGAASRGHHKVQGVSCHVRRGYPVYQASICMETICILAREVLDLSVALDHLLLLLEVKQRVAQGSGRFEHRVEAALQRVLAEHRTTAEDVGLRFKMMISMCFWVLHPLHTPLERDLRHTLHAWSQLSKFRFGTGTGGCKQSADLPREQQERWRGFREAYLGVLEERGRNRAEHEAKLDAMEEAAQPLRDWRIERWNRSQMAEEDHREQHLAGRWKVMHMEKVHRAAALAASHATKERLSAQERVRRRNAAPARRAQRERFRRKRLRKEGRTRCGRHQKAPSEERLLLKLGKVLWHWDRARRLRSRFEKATSREAARAQRLQAKAARAAERAASKAAKAAASQSKSERDQRWRWLNRKDLTMTEMLQG